MIIHPAMRLLLIITKTILGLSHAMVVLVLPQLAKLNETALNKSDPEKMKQEILHAKTVMTKVKFSPSNMWNFPSKIGIYQPKLGFNQKRPIFSPVNIRGLPQGIIGILPLPTDVTLKLYNWDCIAMTSKAGNPTFEVEFLLVVLSVVFI